MGGSSKSGGANQTYVYYGTIACGVCIGPVDDLISIILNGEEVWPQGNPWTGVGGTSTAGQLYVYDAQTWTCTTTVTNTANNAPGGSDLTPGWAQFTMARPALPTTYSDISITTSDGTYYGVLRFYWGTMSQTQDPNLKGTANNGPGLGAAAAGDDHPSYAGLCYIVLINFLLGQEVQSAPNVEIVVRKAPTQTVVTGSQATLNNGQANLAAVVADLLTNPNCIGLPAAALDATTFQAAADYLDTVQPICASSVLVDSSETLRSVLQKVTDLCDGFVRYNPATGLIEMGVYEHGVVPGAYVTLTEDSLTEAPKLKTTSWQGSYSRATVRYPDRQINYQDTSLHADDARAWFVLKSVRDIQLDRPYITIGTQALAHGREMLRLLGHAQCTGTITVRREIARNIRAGSYVLLDVDLEPNNSTVYQFFRVTKRTIPMTGPIKLEIFADNTLATVPALSTGSPSAPVGAAVPAITQFRFIEVPTILSDERGAVIVLAERPQNTITGCQLYFDTNPTGTFSPLGTFPIFGCYATINTAVTNTATSIGVNAAAQVDLAWLQTSYSANDQANDSLLAILVSLVPSGADAGEIAESGGYQEMEICSIGTITLVSAGVYSLAVLRGRQNTEALAVATTHSECWIIPRALLTYFNSSVFDTIRANRLLGTTPAYAQFRLCPYTFVTQLPLSSATSEQFRFPLKSASVPALTLTAPATGLAALAFAPSSFPFFIPINGTWTDPDGALVETTVELILSGAAARLVQDNTFAPCASRALGAAVQIDGPGTFTITISARDSFNVTASYSITATVTSSASKQCAMPDCFDANGNQLLNAGGTPAVYEDVGLGQRWTIVPTTFVPFGPMTLNCTTPGATIYFSCTALYDNGVVTSGNPVPNPPTNVYTPGSLQPFNALVGPNSNSVAPTATSTVHVAYLITTYATASGYSGSQVVTFFIKNLY